MKKITSLLASGAVTLSLMATPLVVSAHGSDNGHRHHEGNFGQKMSAFVHALEGEGDEAKELKKELRNGTHDRDDLDEDADLVTVSGIVTAKSGSTLTVRADDGTVYSVETEDAALSGSAHAAVLADIHVGDRVRVHGTIDGSVITAVKVHDESLALHRFLAAIGAAGAGTVTSLSGSSFTINSRAAGTSTVSTTAGTQYRLNGSATTSGALATSSRAIVYGTVQSDGSITASIVSLFTTGFDFMTRIFTK